MCRHRERIPKCRSSYSAALYLASCWSANLFCQTDLKLFFVVYVYGLVYNLSTLNSWTIDFRIKTVSRKITEPYRVTVVSIVL